MSYIKHISTDEKKITIIDDPRLIDDSLSEYSEAEIESNENTPYVYLPLDNIPDGCAESFPYDIIAGLRKKSHEKIVFS